MNVERRSIVAGLVSATAVVLLGPGQALQVARGAEPSHDVFSSAFAGLFSDGRGARAIGRRYLGQHSVEGDAERLKATLFGGLDDTSHVTLRARLAERRRHDFASGQTIILDGWILARSELQACALLTLLPRM